MRPAHRAARLSALADQAALEALTNSALESFHSRPQESCLILRLHNLLGGREAIRQPRTLAHVGSEPRLLRVNQFRRATNVLAALLRPAATLGDADANKIALHVPSHKKAPASYPAQQEMVQPGPMRPVLSSRKRPR